MSRDKFPQEKVVGLLRLCRIANTIADWFLALFPQRCSASSRSGAWKERVGKSFSRPQRVQCRKKSSGKRLGGDFSCQPGAGAAAQQIHDSARGWRGHNRQTGGCGLQQGVWHAFMARWKHKERRARKECVGRIDVAREADCILQPQLAAKRLEGLLFAACTHEDQLDLEEIAPAPTASAFSSRSKPFSRDSLPTAKELRARASFRSPARGAPL